MAWAKSRRQSREGPTDGAGWAGDRRRRYATASGCGQEGGYEKMIEAREKVVWSSFHKSYNMDRGAVQRAPKKVAEYKTCGDGA
ncbi:uncharacterized protein SPSK_08199 [Sporothrix schenckii 1099-18]|uniref:Uncharacterized protein n=1 Tax=Sporothrix schenckii 1099-18 TaxID=1397361 RepID=A0A0F2MDW0_SPOSC|nr:uncharacterized protein SPSK_08199 [Sporothrix schenckii 1099-18]KJR87878.1 hypothetical protein SPSK_08199 [Sporothrix schenckii 1099-18]